MNKAADKRRNGVVGSNGKKIPIIPNDNDSKPNVARMYFINRFEGCFSILFTYCLFSLNLILL